MKQRSFTESTVNVLKKINLNKIILWIRVLSVFIVIGQNIKTVLHRISYHKLILRHMKNIC
jgi:hypothetical protein